MYTCYIQSFKILASFCSWAGWFESYLVEDPQDTFSRDVAHVIELMGMNPFLQNFGDETESLASSHNETMKSQSLTLIWATSRENLSSGIFER